MKKCDEIKETKFKKVNEECTKVEFKIDGKEWLIAVVYMRESRRQVWASLKEETEYMPGKQLMIGGDFNSRIGEKGGRKTDVDEEERRSSKDKMCNEEGNEMLKWMEEAGMHVLNGNIEGDERGEYTYVGVQGCTVIDYILVNEECREKVKEMTIGRSINSDHLPMQIKLKRGKKEIKECEEYEYEDWSEEGVANFKRKLGEDVIEESWEGIEKAIKKSVSKKKGRKRRRGKENRWWDTECREKRREVARCLEKKLENQKDKEAAEIYEKNRKEYKELIKWKKKMEEEKVLREIEKDRTEKGFWRAVQKDRKKKEISTDIKDEQWHEYFEQQYDGERYEGEEESNAGQREEFHEAEIRREEIYKAIKKLKRRKAPGPNGMKSEAWKEEWEYLIGPMHKCRCERSL